MRSTGRSESSNIVPTGTTNKNSNFAAGSLMSSVCLCCYRAVHSPDFDVRTSEQAIRERREIFVFDLMRLCHYFCASVSLVLT